MAEDLGLPKEEIIINTIFLNYKPFYNQISNFKGNNKSDNIYDNYKKNNIDVDKFFKSNSNTIINNIENSDSPKNNNDIQEIKKDMD